MTPQQVQNIVAAFFEIRDKLRAAEEQRVALERALSWNNTLMWWVLALMVINFALWGVWIFTRVRSDRNQERRFTDMLKIASDQGEVTDRQKVRTFQASTRLLEAGETIAKTGVGASKLAARAAQEARVATQRVAEIGETTAGEIHEIRTVQRTMLETQASMKQEQAAQRAMLTALINKVCPEVLEAIEAGGKE